MDRDVILALSEGAIASATARAVSLRGDTVADWESLEAFVAAADSIRLAILATITDPVDEDKPDPYWARVELFGHTVRYGRVEETRVAGKRFVLLVEPEIYNPAWAEQWGEEAGAPNVWPEVRRTYHPNAIYGIQPANEQDVTDTLRRQRGLHLWDDGEWHTDRQVNSRVVGGDRDDDHDGDETDLF